MLLLVSFEITLKICPEFTSNLRFKFTDHLFYYIIIPTSLVFRHLSFFESSVFIEVLLLLVIFLYLGP